MYDPYAQITKRVLSNGLEVHCSFWDRPWIALEAVIHSGGREDPALLPGLGHFVEHLVGDNIPGVSMDDARDFFELCGGRAAFGMTSYLSTRYNFLVANDAGSFGRALDIFGAMLLSARMDKEVERERSVIERELNLRHPIPEKVEWDMEIRRELFRGHRLETWNCPLGTLEGIRSVTKGDLQEYYDRHYVPANMSLVVVGGILPSRLIEVLEKSPFGIKKDGERNPMPSPLDRLPVPENHFRSIRLSDYTTLKTDQTEYRARWAFPASFPVHARRVFSGVLYRVLFEELRTKRALTYKLNCSVEWFQDVLEYGIRCKVRPEAGDEIDEIVQRCIESVASQGEFFKRKLRSLKQRCRMVDLCGSDLADGSAEDLADYQRIITMEEAAAGLEKVELSQMAEAASYLSREGKYVFVTSP